VQTTSRHRFKRCQNVDMSLCHYVTALRHTNDCRWCNKHIATFKKTMSLPHRFNPGNWTWTSWPTRFNNSTVSHTNFIHSVTCLSHVLSKLIDFSINEGVVSTTDVEASNYNSCTQNYLDQQIAHVLWLLRSWSRSPQQQLPVWVSSFLTAHQHIKGYFVPSRLLWN